MHYFYEIIGEIYKIWGIRTQTLFPLPPASESNKAFKKICHSRFFCDAHAHSLCQECAALYTA